MDVNKIVQLAAQLQGINDTLTCLREWGVSSAANSAATLTVHTLTGKIYISLPGGECGAVHTLLAEICERRRASFEKQIEDAVSPRLQERKE